MLNLKRRKNLKRITLTKAQIDTLVAGSDLTLEISPQRALVLGTKTELQIKKERLQAKYEAEMAKIDGAMNQE